MKPSKPKIDIFRLLLRLWRHLEKRRQSQFLLVLGLMFCSAFAEMATLGTVLPFLGVLANPEATFKYSIVQTFAQLIGVTSGKQMILPLTLLFIVIAMLSAGFRLLVLWASTRLSHMVGVDIGYKIYMNTLYQPYHVHLMRNSSVIINGITQKVINSIYALNMFLNLVISGLLIATICITLFVINPSVTLIAAAIFGGGYFIVGAVFRRLLVGSSEVVAQNSTQLIKCIQEGVGGIRDVLIDGSQGVYGKNYHRISIPLQLADTKITLYSVSPRYAMEALGMSLIVVLAYTLSQQPHGISTALPMLGALALAAQRLLPNLQQSFASWAGITGSQASLADTIELLDQPLPEHATQPMPEPLCFTQHIQIENLSFRYAEDAPWVLRDIDFEVPKGSHIGIVGTTGSGKSTLLDILMGLLDPVKGYVLVDGKRVHGEHLKAWQRNIAHVPQSVFLSDGTVAENIAFGVHPESINSERVKLAARQAQLADFIDGLEQGYQTMVGERGVRLSGGQRQRIGIARALYKRASVIIFDEATSALDNETESTVMDAIKSLGPDLTIFLIAHRLRTVQDCDQIFVLEDGRMVAKGGYQQLLKDSPVFQRLSGESSRYREEKK